MLAWIGITDVNIVLAGRALAGVMGETAVERLGGAVRVAAVRKPFVPHLVKAQADIYRQNVHAASRSEPDVSDLSSSYSKPCHACSRARSKSSIGRLPR